MKTKSLLSLLGISITITALSGIFLTSTVARADESVVDQVNITVPISCTMSGTAMTSHNAEINNGLYQNNIGTTTLHAFCNDAEGFAIYAAGYTGNEVGGTNSNKLVGTVASNNATIETGLATTAGNPDISNWAMKLAITQDSGDITGTNAFTIDSAPNVSGGADASFSSYHVVPNEYTKVAHKDSNTDMTASTGGVKLTTTYAAYISKTQPADTYSGQVIYTLVHPQDAENPGIVSIERAYERAGKQKYNGYYKIQDMTSSICADVNQYSGDGMAEVIDVRDNNIYHIAKLADDNCWMLDNLALDPTDSTTAQNMSASNTNATAAAITNLLNGGSSTTGWSNIAVSDVDSDFYDSANSYVGGYITPRINNASKDTLVTGYGLASTNGQAKVGIYYNYCAASAGTYCYTSSSGVDVVPDAIIDVEQDICPANWRMPSGGDTGEYQTLALNYGNTATETNSVQYNLSVPLSGMYLDNNATEQNNNCIWWTSTYANSSGMYGQEVMSAYYGYMSYGRGGGYPIRCLIK